MSLKTNVRYATDINKKIYMSCNSNHHWNAAQNAYFQLIALQK